MYSQVGTAHDRSQGGLGIGLSLVKRLAELHDGSVEARSDGLGRGSSFIVKLPIPSRAPQRLNGARAIEHEQRAKARRRVLVVDDNLDAADTLAMLITTQGHEVRSAYDGEEAVQVALAFQPDVVLMDIGLPKLHGLEAGKRIRAARGSDLTLIAITGWGQDEDRRRSQQAGFDYHLTKPVDGEAIVRLIDEAAAPQRASAKG
jgi:CheY-like chemotaxis protein